MQVHTFFSEHSSARQKVLYLLGSACLLIYTLFALIGPHMQPKCEVPRGNQTYRNVDFNANFNPCYYTRMRCLGGLNLFETEMFQRVLVALACGSLVGIERTTTHVFNAALMMRLMSSLALGACIVTIASMFSYLSGPYKYDASRATAQIPKGVGILCGAVLWVSKLDSKVELRGATTSATAWSAAAIGVLVGGGLFTPAAFATVLCVSYSYFGRAAIRLVHGPARLRPSAATIPEDVPQGLQSLARPLLDKNQALHATNIDSHQMPHEPTLVDSRLVLPRL